jgi:hypothetical protein
MQKGAGIQDENPTNSIAFRSWMIFVNPRIKVVWALEIWS